MTWRGRLVARPCRRSRSPRLAAPVAGESRLIHLVGVVRVPTFPPGRDQRPEAFSELRRVRVGRQRLTVSAFTGPLDRGWVEAPTYYSPAGERGETRRRAGPGGPGPG